MDLNELFRIINQSVLELGYEPLQFYAAFFAFHLIIYLVFICVDRFFVGLLEYIKLYKKKKEKKDE